MRNNTNDKPLGITRRTMLKAAAATTAGAALFSGTASATDDTALISVACIGEQVSVTLNSIDLFGGGAVDPVDVDNLEVAFGKYDVINHQPMNDRVDGNEINRCLNGDSRCDPIAYPTSQTENTDGSITFTFDRADAGLDGPTTSIVALVGRYDGPDGTRQEFDSYGEVQEGDSPNEIVFDPADCCEECPSGKGDLLVKYEWEGGKFVIEGGSDDGITLESVELDDDGEPKKACFSTSYCTLDAVVKAATQYEVTSFDDSESEGTTVCVERIGKYAISNIRFYCVAPDDLSVGNGGKKDGDDDDDDKRGRGRDDDEENRGRDRDNDDDERDDDEDDDDRGRGRGRGRGRD